MDDEEIARDTERCEIRASGRYATYWNLLSEDTPTYVLVDWLSENNFPSLANYWQEHAKRRS